ncbi:MAG: hypothetical protein ACFCUM_03785 [Bacteroidales bacterium]
MLKLIWLSALSFFALSTIALSQQNNPFSELLSPGNVYATMFFDYFYMAGGDDMYPGQSQYAGNKKNDNAFSFRRIYLGYEHAFSGKFSGKIQMELKDFSTLENGSRSFFLKEASLTWKDIYPLADLIIGQSGTPAYSIDGSESYWRYRSIEATIADMRGLRSSSDAGIRIKGRFNESGTLGYNFMAGNGNGTRPENDKYKLFYLNLWTKLLEKRLYIEMYQDFNKASGGRTVSTTKGFIAWAVPDYTFGLELVHQLRSGFGPGDQDMDILGTSIFAHANITGNQLRIFARYDSYNPDNNFSIDHYFYEYMFPYDEQFYTLGLDIMPGNNIHIMPNIWINSYKNKIIGRAPPEAKVVARITFNVVFR